MKTVTHHILAVLKYFLRILTPSPEVTIAFSVTDGPHIFTKDIRSQHDRKTPIASTIEKLLIILFFINNYPSHQDA
jgi:hypothetical protein